MGKELVEARGMRSANTGGRFRVKQEGAGTLREGALQKKQSNVKDADRRGGFIHRLGLPALGGAWDQERSRHCRLGTKARKKIAHPLARLSTKSRKRSHPSVNSTC